MRAAIVRGDLAKMIAGTIGNEKALEAVATACSAAGITEERLTLEEALAVLGRIAETPGVVGITARFAKSRMHLKST